MANAVDFLSKAELGAKFSLLNSNKVPSVYIDNELVAFESFTIQNVTSGSTVTVLDYNLTIPMGCSKLAIFSDLLGTTKLCVFLNSEKAVLDVKHRLIRPEENWVILKEGINPDENIDIDVDPEK